MFVNRRQAAMLLASLALGLPAAAARAQVNGVLRVTAIPDESPTELQRKFGPLGEYLAARTGLKVEFTPVTDYAAAVEALVNRKVDLVWYGGFTFVQAKIRSNDGVVPLVQRAEDERFQSVFVSADDSIRTLADLKGRTLSFGSPSSTSGHLMPRHHLRQAGIDPDRDLKRVAFSGAHDATVSAVAGGRVDAGALNASVWDKLVLEGRVDASRVKPFYKTPPYHDYNWTVHRDMEPALRDKITQAFLELDPADPAHRAILGLQRASRFVPTRAQNYEAIEQIARSAELIK